MNLLIVFAFAGDSTMTRFFDIAERRNALGGGRYSGALLLLVLVLAAGALVFLGLVVERFVRDAEDLGGAAAVAVGHGQRLFDDDPLDLLHRLPEGNGDGVL